MSFVVFTGGSGFNETSRVLQQSVVSTHRTDVSVSYIVPLTDDGGSSREIIDAVGGPAIGDLRSRLLRLSVGLNPALLHVLEHRLGFTEPDTEWTTILNLSHSLWQPLLPLDSAAALVHALLHYFAACITTAATTAAAATVAQKSAAPVRPFSFGGGSIGNFVFTALRIYTRSLVTATDIFSSLGAYSITAIRCSPLRSVQFKIFSHNLSVSNFCFCLQRASLHLQRRLRAVCRRRTAGSVARPQPSTSPRWPPQCPWPRASASCPRAPRPHRPRWCWPRGWPTGRRCAGNARFRTRRRPLHRTTPLTPRSARLRSRPRTAATSRPARARRCPRPCALSFTPRRARTRVRARPNPRSACARHR